MKYSMIPPVSSRIFQPFVMYRLSLCRMWVEKAWDECVLRDANVLKTALFIDAPRWPSGRRWVLSAPWAATLGALRMCQVLFRGGSSTSRHSGQRLAVMLPMRLRGARALAWGPWGGGGRPWFRPRQVGCRHAAGCSPTSSTQGTGNSCPQVPSTVSPTLAPSAHQHRETTLAFLLESSRQNPPSPSPPPRSKMVLCLPPLRPWPQQDTAFTDHKCDYYEAISVRFRAGRENRRAWLSH